MRELLNVGDVLIVKNFLGTSRLKITRVTKTLAKSKRDDGYEHTFKREISGNMSHPYQPHSCTKYTVERAQGETE